MNPWFETFGVILLALSGAAAGRVFSYSRKSIRVWGYILPFVLIAIILLAKYNCSLAFIPPFSWLTAGRIKYVVLSMIITIGLTTPLAHLPYRTERIVTCILMIVLVTYCSILPFLVPVLIKTDLTKLETRFDSNGICRQSKEYTCGPAAAVTALNRLGLNAQEGEIAVLSYTSPVTGTLPQCLNEALNNRYNTEGLVSQYRNFDSVSQLKDERFTLAVIRDAFMLDHCVTVLDISETSITIADPAIGMQSIPLEQFEKIWRFSGIVLKRNFTQKI